MKRALVLLACLSLVAAAPAAAREPSLMHGFIDQSSMTLWVQTERAARVAVDLHPESAPAKRRRYEGAARAEDDFALRLRLAGLEPGTR